MFLHCVKINVRHTYTMIKMIKEQFSILFYFLLLFYIIFNFSLLDCGTKSNSEYLP